MRQSQGKEGRAMKTVNLGKESPSVDELSAMARKKSVLLVSDDGTTFLLEEADDFDHEVAVLGNSDRFISFLRRRSEEKRVISVEAFAEELTHKVLDKAARPTRSRSKSRRVPSGRKSHSRPRG